MEATERPGVKQQYLLRVHEGFHFGFEMVAAVIDLEDAYKREPLDFLFEATPLHQGDRQV